MYCIFIEEYRIKRNEWADKHLMLAKKKANGDRGDILAVGRMALPEGLRILGLSGPVAANLDNAGAEFMDTSPKGSCP